MPTPPGQPARPVLSAVPIKARVNWKPNGFSAREPCGDPSDDSAAQQGDHCIASSREVQIGPCPAVFVTALQPHQHCSAQAESQGS